MNSKYLRPDWTVVYQKGGTDNATWHRTLLVGTLEEMQVEEMKLHRSGYNAYTKRIHDVNTIGLPEGYAPLHDSKIRNAQIQLERLGL